MPKPKVIGKIASEAGPITRDAVERLSEDLQNLEDSLGTIYANGRININYTQIRGAAGDDKNVYGKFGLKNDPSNTLLSSDVTLVWDPAYAFVHAPGTSGTVPLTINSHTSQSADLLNVNGTLGSGIHVINSGLVGIFDGAPEAYLSVKAAGVGEADVLALSPVGWWAADDPANDSGATLPSNGEELLSGVSNGGEGEDEPTWVWRDKSGNTRDQGSDLTYGNRPLWYNATGSSPAPDELPNGKPVVSFLSSRNVGDWTFANNNFITIDDFTVYGVVYMSATGGPLIGEHNADGGGTRSSTFFRVQDIEGNTGDQSKWVGSQGAVGGETTQISFVDGNDFTGTNWRRVMFRREDSTQTHEIDGTNIAIEQTDGDPATTSYLEQLMKVRLGSSTLWSTWVAEILVFDKALTAGERETVEAYLDGKYNTVGGGSGGGVTRNLQEWKSSLNADLGWMTSQGTLVAQTLSGLDVDSNTGTFTGNVEGISGVNLDHFITLGQFNDTGDENWLRLDTSNDPLSDNLEISGSADRSLTIRSNQNASIVLLGDADNVDETNHAFITMAQDGGGLSGTIGFTEDGSQKNDLRIATYHNNMRLRLYTSGLEDNHLVINRGSENNYVGIHNETPRFHLDVSGECNAQLLRYDDQDTDERYALSGAAGSSYLRLDTSNDPLANTLSISGTGANEPLHLWGSDERRGMAIGFSANGNRLYFAPWEDGSWQYSNEFAYSYFSNRWEVETDLYVGGDVYENGVALDGQYLKLDISNDPLQVDASNGLELSGVNAGITLRRTVSEGFIRWVRSDGTSVAQLRNDATYSGLVFNRGDGVSNGDIMNAYDHAQLEFNTRFFGSLRASAKNLGSGDIWAEGQLFEENPAVPLIEKYALSGNFYPFDHIGDDDKVSGLWTQTPVLAINFGDEDDKDTLATSGWSLDFEGGTAYTSAAGVGWTGGVCDDRDRGAAAYSYEENTVHTATATRYFNLNVPGNQEYFLYFAMGDSLFPVGQQYLAVSGTSDVLYSGVQGLSAGEFAIASGYFRGTGDHLVLQLGNDALTTNRINYGYVMPGGMKRTLDFFYQASGTSSPTEAGSTTFSGLNDVQDDTWTSGQIARYDGTNWVPYEQIPSFGDTAPTAGEGYRKQFGVVTSGGVDFLVVCLSGIGEYTWETIIQGVQ